MEKMIAVLAGDGIGQEIMPQALRALNVIEEKFDHDFHINTGYIGGEAYEKFGTHFPDETKMICEKSDAILFGSVGGPISESDQEKWKNCERNSILALRKVAKLNANFRPIRVYPELSALSPLKESFIQKGLNILIVRELIGDIYFGEHKQWSENDIRFASDVAEYNEEQIRSISHVAFKQAQNRRKKLCSVDKANVLETSKLWRDIVNEVSKNYPDVKVEHMLVDNCAMQIFLNPAQFDVILTSNLFGDILSDAAAALPGSLGLIPSASLNPSGFGLYEPAGGSAPDIAGKNIANPIAQILSAAMLLRYSFNLEREASDIENAVQKALQDGFRSRDIYTEGTKLVRTEQMADAIISNIINGD